MVSSVAAGLLLGAGGNAFAAGGKKVNRLAVIIGNQKYLKRDVPNVAYALNDARAFKDYLVDVQGYKDTEILLIENANKADLEELFGNATDHRGLIFQRASKGKTELLVYYSGHGVPSLTSKKGYLLPVTASAGNVHLTGYSLELMYENLSKLKLKSVTAILEACFSGLNDSADFTTSSSGGDKEKVASFFGESSIAFNAKDSTVPDNITVISAAKGDQIATWDRELKLGVFTSQLLRALYGMADSKINGGDGDGKVTLAELDDFLVERVGPRVRQLREGRRQRPDIVSKSKGLVLASLTGRDEVIVPDSLLFKDEIARKVKYGYANDVAKAWRVAKPRAEKNLDVKIIDVFLRDWGGQSGEFRARAGFLKKAILAKIDANRELEKRRGEQALRRLEQGKRRKAENEKRIADAKTVRANRIAAAARRAEAIERAKPKNNVGNFTWDP